MSVVEVTVTIENVDAENNLQCPPQAVISPVVEDTFYNSDCAICLESIDDLQKEGQEIVTFHCMHRLCRECTTKHITTQLRKNLDISCPVCRNVLLDAKTLKYVEHRINYFNNIHIHTGENQVRNVNATTQWRYNQQQLSVMNGMYFQAQFVSATHGRFERTMSWIPCMFIVAIIIIMLIVYQSGAFS